MTEVNKCSECSYLDRCEQVNYIGNRAEGFCEDKKAYIRLFDHSGSLVLGPLHPEFFNEGFNLMEVV